MRDAGSELGGDAFSPSKRKTPLVRGLVKLTSPYGWLEKIFGGILSLNKGDVLCIIEAMKLMNEVTAQHSGVIQEILIKNEEPVQYNQVLFKLRTK